jgi:hypothetical protein
MGTNQSQDVNTKSGNNELVLDANQTYLRITSVTPKSPEFSLNIDPFFHFIVKVHPCKNNFNLERDFYQWVIENENKTVKLFLYHTLEKKLEIKEIVPNRNWPNADSLLGIKTRAESLSSAHSSVFRINGICRYDFKGVLVPREDFIIAAKDFVFTDLNELKSKIERFGECQIMIYNLAKNELREETLNLQGGQLGLEIGKGLLNDLDYNYGLFRKSQRNNQGKQKKTIAKLRQGNEQIELISKSEEIPKIEAKEVEQIMDVNDSEKEEAKKEDVINEI